MLRKVRILQIPLNPLKNLGLHSLTNPLLSHWALLIGENDLLLEIFPKSSKNKWAPENVLIHTHNPDLNSRKSKFKIGIFGQPDTDWDDEAIIKAANEIIRRKPIYNFVTFNCQSFVNSLANKIANRGVGTKIVRIFTPPPLRPFVWKDIDGVLVEAGPETAATDVQAEQKKELDFLEDLPRIWGLNPSKALYPDELPEASLDTGESANEGLFRLNDQTYIADYDVGNLGGIGVAYDQAGSRAAYVLADILVPEDPDDLTDADGLDLNVAYLLAGQAEHSRSQFHLRHPMIPVKFGIG